MKNTFFLLLALLGVVATSSAQVVINEYSASNLSGFTDNFGKTEDWIELYNTDAVDIDISGWHLSDKESKPAKWEIPAGTIIPANDHLLFLCSGRDGFTNGEYHTNFKLAQSQGTDIVLLSDANENIVEMYDLALTLTEHSRCRVTDGAAEWRICTAPSYATSNDGTAQINDYTATPSASLNAGFYEGAQSVTLTNNEPNSVLRYTVDGTNPRQNSSEYTEAISIDATQVVKAQAFSNDPLILPGKMDFNTYFIDEEYSLAVFSVAADEVINLANGNGGLIPIGSLEYFNTEKEREATSFGSLNRHGQDSWILDHRSIDWVSRDEMGYSKSVDAPLFSYSDRDEYQKFMFRNSGDDNYPANDDFNHQGSTHVRDEYVQTLAQVGGMEVDLRAVERVVLFLNGQYWGVYGMRDRPVDHDYTDYYYDQGKYDIQYLTTWGNTDIQYGGQKALEDWTNLRNFILQNDMSIESNYVIAEDSINMTSMIDYMLMNLNVVASDWLNYNTGWWRGLNPDGKHKKWGYILWDLDATFDYYINYSGVPNISPNAAPCDLEDIADFMDGFFGGGFGGGGGGGSNPVENPEECETIVNGTSPYPVTDTIFLETIAQDGFCCDTEWDGICQDLYDDIAANGSGTGGGGNGGGNTGNNGNDDVGQHEKILLKLLDENPDFKQLYYSRYADLMNTVFTCDNMNTVLDSLIAVIEPEMPRQIDRWGGTMTEWESNVQDLKDFVNERCTLLAEGATSCYDELTGPYQVTLMTEPVGVGEIDFNTLDIESFPWTANYFGGMENKIKAKVFDELEEEYEFSHWVSAQGNVIAPNVNERKATLSLTQADTLTAVFVPLGTVSNNDLDAKYAFEVFPNPARDKLILKYDLNHAKQVQVDLFNVMGQHITAFPQASGMQNAGGHTLTLPLDKGIVDGLYFLVVNIAGESKSFKVNIVK